MRKEWMNQQQGGLKTQKECVTKKRGGVIKDRQMKKRKVQRKIANTFKKLR